MNKNQDKGFTLVELLIVIVILGILATVTVFAVRGITDQGESNACSTEKRAVETAIEAYYTQNNQTDATSLSQLVGADAYLKTEPELRDHHVRRGTPTVAANSGINDC